MSPTISQAWGRREGPWGALPSTTPPQDSLASEAQRLATLTLLCRHPPKPACRCNKPAGPFTLLSAAIHADILNTLKNILQLKLLAGAGLNSLAIRFAF